jgi:hypothetical protein
LRGEPGFAHDSCSGQRPDRELRIARHADFSDRHDIETRTQCSRYLEGDGNASPRQSDHQAWSRQTALSDRVGQLDPGQRAIRESVWNAIHEE